jgi:hypothetical protein
MSSMSEVSEEGREAHDNYLANGKMKTIHLTVEITMQTSLNPLDARFQRDVERLIYGYKPLAKDLDLTVSSFLEVNCKEVRG